MKFSVCTDSVFANKLTTSESVSELKKIGYNSLEFWSWWDKNLSDIKQNMDEFNVSIAAMCTRFVSLVDEKKRSEYLCGLSESIEVAKLMGCKTLISQTGDFIKDIDPEKQHETLCEGLKQAAILLKSTDITLVVEPLNLTVDHKGYYLSASKEAFSLVDEVGSEHVKILYDIYHQQITEGNLIATIVPNISKIAHFHCAGTPGRNSILTGEINYDAVFSAISKTDYDGYIGLEFFPKNDAIFELTAIRDELISKWS